MFDGDAKTREEGVKDFLLQLLDIKAGIIQGTSEEALHINPDFIKPIIAILNTQAKKDLDKNATKDPNDITDSHWIYLTILPKQFKGLLGKNKYHFSSERVYSFDSLSNNRRIPEELTRYLREERQFERKHDSGKHIYKFPQMIDNSSHFREFSERQQENSSCGYWAIFNGVMITLAGMLVSSGVSSKLQ